MRRFDYFKPQSLEELWEIKRNIPDARFIAGGTDVLVQIKNGELFPSALISLRSIVELSWVEVNTATRIGATATINQLSQHTALGDAYPLLMDAAQNLGSAQIRNTATIGGNLCNCSPSADMALPLLALEAKVRIQTYNSSREIPIQEFFLGPGKSCLTSDSLLTDILLDPPAKKTKSIFMKMGRVKMDLAIASMAVLMELEGKKCQKARIAAGSVAPVPLRLLEVEKLIEGTALTPDIVAPAQKCAQESVDPISDVRASKTYRKEIIGVFVKRAIEKFLGETSK